MFSLKIGKSKRIGFLLVFSMATQITACGGGSSGTESSSGSSSSSSSGGSTNYPPVIDQLIILPEEAYTNTILSVHLEARDLEEDPFTTNYQWRVNGEDVSGATSDTLAPKYFVKGDEVSVTVSLDDGSDSVSESVNIIIQDSLPNIELLGVPKSAPYGQELKFSVLVEDPDGDAFDMHFLARPNGMAIDEEGTVTWTPSSPLFVKETDFNWKISVVTQDGVSESGSTITVIDSDRKYPLNRNGGLLAEHSESLAIGDFDGDNIPELLATDGDKNIYTLEGLAGDYVQNWNYPFALSGSREDITAVAAADLDGDGTDEALVGLAHQQFRADSAKLVVIGGENREILETLDVEGGGISAIRVGDMDGNGSNEIILLINGENLSESYLEIRNYSLGLIWRSADLGRVESIAVGRVVNDAWLDIVASNGYVYGYDGLTYSNKWYFDEGFGNEVHIGDLDGDGIEEIVAARKSSLEGVAVFDANKKGEIVRYDYSGRYFRLAVGDVDGKVGDEIVLVEQHSSSTRGVSAKLHALGFVNGALSDLWSMDSTVYTNHVVTFGDITGDGVPDLVWGGEGSRDYSSLVIAEKNGSSPVEIYWQKSSPSQLDGNFIGGEIFRGSGVSSLLFASKASDSKVSGPRFLRLNPQSGMVDMGDDREVNSTTFAFVPADSDHDGTDEVYMAAISSYGSEDDWGRHLAVQDIVDGTFDVVASSLSFEGNAVAQADLNADLIPELIAVFRDGAVRAYDVAQSTVWLLSDGGQTGRSYSDIGVDVNAVDFNADNRPEVVAATRKGIFVFTEAEGGYALKYQNTDWLDMSGQYIVDSEVADVDGDGIPEVIVASASNVDSTIRVLDAKLQLKSSIEIEETVVSSISAETYGVGARNILVAAVSDTSRPLTQLWVMDPNSGEVVMRSPDIPGEVSPNSLHYPYVDGGDIPRISYGTSLVMAVTR